MTLGLSRVAGRCAPVMTAFGSELRRVFDGRARGPRRLRRKPTHPSLRNRLHNRFSKVIRAIAVRKTTAVTVASALIEVWVASYGPPDRLLHDQGRQFMSEFFKAVCRALGSDNKDTTPWHPQTNGEVERYNRTIVTQIRHYVFDNPRRWDELLPVLTYAYNTQPHRSTGIAPFELVIPRRIPSLVVRNPPPGVAIQAQGGPKDGSPLSVKRASMARPR